jgi:hypothetical protein
LSDDPRELRRDLLRFGTRRNPPRLIEQAPTVLTPKEAQQSAKHPATGRAHRERQQELEEREQVGACTR